MLEKIGYLGWICWLKLYKHFVYLNRDVDAAKWYNFYHPHSGMPGGLTFGGIVVLIWCLFWLVF